MSSSSNWAQRCSRQEYLREHPSARRWAELDSVKNEAMDVAYKPYMPRGGSLNGKKVVIIGSGVGGLTTAYELLSRNDNIQVTILEARDRTGGRCLTLRTGDTLTEDQSGDLHSSKGETQVVSFDHPVGDNAPYLNAGPGRIPSSHYHLLDYLRVFGVELEVYIMDSDSNLSQMPDGPEGDLLVNRRLDHNTRGWIAQMVHENASVLLGSDGDAKKIENLQSLMRTFGDLRKDGKYVVGISEPGEDYTPNFSDRAGFVDLPGYLPGRTSDAIDLDSLLNSQFWEKTNVYQPEDFLWQPSLFQPVGGMDRVQQAFAQQIATLGGVVHLNSPVTKISYDRSKTAEGGSFRITADGHDDCFIADYCFCNLAMPFLEDILSDDLQSLGDTSRGFNPGFKEALRAVYATQACSNPTERFLAPTTKVGWQANRELWEGRRVETTLDEMERPMLSLSCPSGSSSQVGVVPVYGGISWTAHSITQIWYPSTGYNDKRGVLTGAYNFGCDATAAGCKSVEERLADAKEGARGFGEEFAKGLENGVAIAWQKMAYIKGGWPQWQYVTDGAKHFNSITQGTGVDGQIKPCFFVVGDQASSLPGWQEGAITAALSAISRLCMPTKAVPHVKSLPDTRLMVEGL